MSGTPVQIHEKEEINIRNSAKTFATIYGGTAGKSKSTNPKDIEAEVRSAFETIRKNVQKGPALPSIPSSDNPALSWNPTSAAGTGPVKPKASVSVTTKKADVDDKSVVTAPEQTQPTTEPRDANFFDLTLNSFNQGYYDSRRNQEAWKAMQGRDNEMEKYTEILNSDKYNFEADKWWQQGISGAAAQAGQWARQITDPETLALTAGLGGVALLAGQIGPLVALPDEIFTLPSALSRGLKVGVAKAGMEIEGGRAYLEMLDHGISEETAALLATGVGAVNGVLDTVQLDELMDAYRILDKVGADDITRSVILQELNKRLKDIFPEAGLETLQEGVAIAGTQIGSKVDTGEWAYTRQEVADLLGDAATSAVLTYGLTNALPAAHNIHTRNRNRLSALGEKKLRAGEMPTSQELEAMNLSESEALGRMVLFQMEEPEDVNIRDDFDEIITDGSHLEDGKLQANVTYLAGEHDYIYTTNEAGLISHVRADDLQFKTHDGRLNHNPHTYGKQEGDHAGHLIGDQFGGSPDLDNLVSQAKNVNLSKYKVIENQWASALKRGEKVSVNIDIKYDAGSPRPTAFEVSYKINGEKFHYTVNN